MKSKPLRLLLPEGHRYLEPIYMDKSHTSYAFFTGYPWTKSVGNRPYKHDYPGSDLHALAYPHAKDPNQAVDEEDSNQLIDKWIPELLSDEETAQDLTKILMAEAETAWGDASALKNSLNINILTGLLEHVNAAQLKDIVNRSWLKLFDQWWSFASNASDRRQTASSPTTQTKEGAASWFAYWFGTGYPLPEGRDIDVTECFRRSLDDSVYLESLSRPGDGKRWNSLFHFHEYAEEQVGKEWFGTHRVNMLPFLNQEDLSDPQILRSLILNRIANHPRVFARADWEGCHLGRAGKFCVPAYHDNWFMGFPPEAELLEMKQPHERREYFHDYAVVFKGPTGEDTKDGLFPRLKKAGLLFGWEEGIMVLAIQAVTLRFVKVVAEDLSAFVDGLRSRGEDLNGQPVSKHLPICKAHTWETIPTELLRFDAVGKGLVTSGQFFPPSVTASSWGVEFKSRLEKRVAFAKEQLRELCHDPAVFRRSIQNQYDQHYGHITDSSDNGNDEYRILPHITNTDIDAKKALVNDLIRRVVRRAVFEVEMWQCLLDKLIRLRELAEDENINLDDRIEQLDVQGPVMDAWVDLGFHARWIAALHVRHLFDHGGLLATHSIRDYFRRTQTWDQLRPEAPSDQWILPREGRIKMDFSAVAGYKKPLNVEGWEDVRLATDAVHRGLSSFYSIGRIGLPKIIQKMHSDRRRHALLGVQPMVSEDYTAIFEAGLLSQRMEAMQPFGGDLSTDDMTDLREKSPIWQFLKEYDHFPFERHIDQETLRLVHWFLGVTYYHPSLPESQSRPFGLVQKWLDGFWTEIATWLESGNVWRPQKTSVNILSQAFNELQISVGIKDIDEDFRMQNDVFDVEGKIEDEPMVDYSEVLHIDASALTAPIVNYGEVKIISEDDFPGSKLLDITGYVYECGEKIIARTTFPQPQKEKERGKRPARKKKRTNAQGKVTKATARHSSHPSTFFKAWKAFDKGGIRFQEGTFNVTKICGKITNLRPANYEEPPTEFVMPTRNGMIRKEELKKVTMELAKCQRGDDYKRHLNDLMAADPLRGTNKIRKKEWRTMEIIYGDHSTKRKITYKNVEDLFVRLGFEFGDGSGSREKLQWTENSHIPREKLNNMDSQVHPLHRKADTLNESFISSLKKLLEDWFGISQKTIETYYQRAGPEYELVSDSRTGKNGKDDKDGQNGKDDKDDEDDKNDKDGQDDQQLGQE
ncbi:hypothetical protein KNSL1_004469 [Colletotrichum chrysophilum]|nr:hypothetical protein KNSL1_004469 [Colletotrichum chrysophilum]